MGVDPALGTPGRGDGRGGADGLEEAWGNMETKEEKWSPHGRKHDGLLYIVKQLSLYTCLVLSATFAHIHGLLKQ